MLQHIRVQFTVTINTSDDATDQQLHQRAAELAQTIRDTMHAVPDLDSIAMLQADTTSIQIADTVYDIA